MVLLQHSCVRDFIVPCQNAPPECRGQGFLLAGESRRDTATCTGQLGQRPTEKRQLLIPSGPDLAVQPFCPVAQLFS